MCPTKCSPAMTAMSVRALPVLRGNNREPLLKYPSPRAPRTTKTSRRPRSFWDSLGFCLFFMLFMLSRMGERGFPSLPPLRLGSCEGPFDPPAPRPRPSPDSTIYARLLFYAPACSIISFFHCSFFLFVSCPPPRYLWACVSLGTSGFVCECELQLRRWEAMVAGNGEGIRNQEPGRFWRTSIFFFFNVTTTRDTAENALDEPLHLMLISPLFSIRICTRAASDTFLHAIHPRHENLTETGRVA